MGTRIAKIINYAAMIAVVVGFGVVNTRDGRRLQTIAAQIAEQKREKKNIARERLQQKETIAGVQKEVAAVGDSVDAGVQMGMAMKRSQSIAKGMLVLDNRELRANKRIKGARKREAEVEAHRTRWRMGFGAAFAVIAGVVVALRRFGGGAAHPGVPGGGVFLPVRKPNYRMLCVTFGPRTDIMCEFKDRANAWRSVNLDLRRFVGG